MGLVKGALVAIGVLTGVVAVKRKISEFEVNDKARDEAKMAAKLAVEEAKILEKEIQKLKKSQKRTGISDEELERQINHLEQNFNNARSRVVAQTETKREEEKRKKEEQATRVIPSAPTPDYYTNANANLR